MVLYQNNILNLKGISQNTYNKKAYLSYITYGMKIYKFVDLTTI
jgi:hypothetical protein